MSKPAAPSPSKSFRARMGTAMRRSSSALSFTRPGTARSSTESLRLDAKLQAAPSSEQVHSLPSPVPESPAAEIAASVQEPQGPSKLSEPPVVASEPIDIPQKAPEPEALVASPEPMTIPDTTVTSSAPPTEPEPVVARETVSTPEPMSREISTQQSVGDTLQSSRAEDAESSAPSSDTHAVPSSQPAGPPPTEVVAAPWNRHEGIPEPEPVPAPAPASVVAKPESVHRNPWISADSASTVTTVRQTAAPIEPAVSEPVPEIVAVEEAVAEPVPVVQGRARSGTVASQTRARTPLLNGKLSRQPSLASLASSIAAQGGPGPVIPPGLRDEDNAAPSVIPSGILADPFADPIPIDVRSPLDRGDQMPEPSISMPVAQPSGPIFYAQPIQNVPSGYSIAGNSAIAMMPREHLPYDTDETRPLLHAPSMKDSVNYSQSGPALAVAPYYQSGGSSIWPAPLRNFGTMGWQEHTLLTGNTYYSHSSLHITVDIDLRNPEKLEALGAFLEKKDVADTLVLPSDDWELWLRDAGRANNEFIPLRAWVHHTLRIVSLEQPPTVTEDFRIREDDKLELEYRYWAFLEAHPAHAPLPPSCVTEAIDVLTWSYTDRLLPSSQPTPPPFTQSECQDLMALLRSLEGAANTSSSHSVLRTRVVAKILMRILSWRQGRSPSGATSQDANGRADNSRRTSLRRTVGDFLISAVCLGIPYLFLERSHHQRMDAESGLRSTAGPMLIVGAFACVIAAVILSASVTFISLPGLDDVARVAGFVAILLSATSLASGVLAVFRYKVDIERIPSYARGEGLITKRSVLLSLPLVFLIWAIIAFITGVTLYAFRGLATTSPGAISRHFQEYTQWAVVGTVGGLAGMLITSALLLAW